MVKHILDRTLDWSTLPLHLWRNYLNVSTVVMSLILSKKLFLFRTVVFSARCIR